MPSLSNPFIVCKAMDIAENAILEERLTVCKLVHICFSNIGNKTMSIITDGFNFLQLNAVLKEWFGVILMQTHKLHQQNEGVLVRDKN